MAPRFEGTLLFLRLTEPFIATVTAGKFGVAKDLGFFLCMHTKQQCASSYTTLLVTSEIRL